MSRSHSCKKAKQKESKQQRIHRAKANNKNSQFHNKNNNNNKQQKKSLSPDGQTNPQTPRTRLSSVLQAVSDGTGPVPRGLMNLGNTCYFNSVMQNLARVDALRDYFIGTAQAEGEGEMTKTLRAFMMAAWDVDGDSNNVSSKGRGKALNPGNLLDCVGDASAAFKGRSQHDAHELMRVVFDGVVEEEKKRLRDVAKGLIDDVQYDEDDDEESEESNDQESGNDQENDLDMTKSLENRNELDQKVTQLTDHGKDPNNNNDTNIAYEPASSENVAKVNATANGKAHHNGDDERTGSDLSNGIVVLINGHHDENEVTANGTIKEDDEDDIRSLPQPNELPAPSTDSSQQILDNGKNDNTTNKVSHSNGNNDTGTASYSSSAKKNDMEVAIPAKKLVTIIDKTFGGMLSSTIFCKRCGSKSSVTEPFFDLQLPLVPKDEMDKEKDDEEKEKQKLLKAASKKAGKSKGFLSTSSSSAIPTENSDDNENISAPVYGPAPRPAASSSSSPPPAPPPPPPPKTPANCSENGAGSVESGHADVMTQLRSMRGLREKAELPEPQLDSLTSKRALVSSPPEQDPVGERSLILYEPASSILPAPSSPPPPPLANDLSEEEEEFPPYSLFDMDNDDEEPASASAITAAAIDDVGDMDAFSTSKAAASTAASASDSTSTATGKKGSSGSGSFFSLLGFGGSGNAAPYGYRGVVDSLKEFSKAEVLKDENAYGCEECTRREKVAIAMERMKELERVREREDENVLAIAAKKSKSGNGDGSNGGLLDVEELLGMKTEEEDEEVEEEEGVVSGMEKDANTNGHINGYANGKGMENGQSEKKDRDMALKGAENGRMNGNGYMNGHANGSRQCSRNGSGESNVSVNSTSSEQRVLIMSSSPVTSSESSSGVSTSSDEDEGELVIEEEMETRPEDMATYGSTSPTRGKKIENRKLTREEEDDLIKEMEVGEVTMVRTTAEKRMMIKKAPEVLAIQLKRFSQYGFRGGLRKMTGHVKFGSVLNLEAFMDRSVVDGKEEDSNDEEFKYELSGIAVHCGSLSGGHYVSYVRRGAPSSENVDEEGVDDRVEWYCCNDSRVSKTSAEDVLDNEAYLLLYQRRRSVDKA